MARQTFYQPNRQRRGDDDAYSDDQGWRPQGVNGQSAQASQNAQNTIDDIDSLLNEEKQAASATQSGGVSKASADAAELKGQEKGDDSLNYTGTGGEEKSTDNEQKVKFSGWWTKKRVAAAGGATSVLLGGGLLGFSFLQGPFEVIHAAQVLEGLHLQTNEDFGDSRGQKVLVYALGGGSERTNLGILGNQAADKWEAKLVADAGLKPIYSARTGLFRGFEVTDEAKARDKVPQLFDDSIDGVKVTTAGDAGKGGQAVRGTKKIGGGNTTLSSDTRIIDTGSVKDGDIAAKRGIIKTVGKATETNKLVSSMASRLLKKRAGVNFHLFGDTRRPKEKLADYFARRKQDQAKEDRTGVQANSTTATQEEDKNGNVTNQADVEASSEANSAIQEAEAATSKQAIQDIAKKLGKGGAAVGILCAVRGFGNDIPKYKYAQDALPMMRMGMDLVTEGNEVMSGQGVSLDELGALNQQMYDATSNTSFFDATSIRQGFGEDTSGSVDVPQEAKLSGINNKPEFFNIMDDIPVLGTVCGAISSISSIPILGDVVNAATSVFTGAIDGILSAFHTSLEDLMTGALSIAAGKSVDVTAKGGQFGALADTGTFLSANDNIMSMGGAAMSTQQAALLNSTATTDAKQDLQSESIADRYLNPYQYNSMVGTMIDSMPHSATQLADSLASPLQSITSVFGTMGKLFAPRAFAAQTPYDYGAPQFGFTLSEQNDPQFENPYDNAVVVEPELDTLNAKYGSCFGMTATVSDSGVQLQTANAGDDSLNQFKIADKPVCHDGSEDLLRYRFYLADAASVSSLDCYETNNTQACNNIDMGDGSDATTPTGDSGTTPGDPTSSDVVSLAKQVLASPNITLVKDCQTGSSGAPAYGCAYQDILAASQGKKVTPGFPRGNSGLPACSARTPEYLDASLLQGMLAIAQKYKYQVHDIDSGHDCDTGNHPLGKAFDIYQVAGENIQGHCTDSNMRDFDNYVAQTMSQVVGKGQAGIGTCTMGILNNKPANIQNFVDGSDQLHVDVRS